MRSNTRERRALTPQEQERLAEEERIRRRTALYRCIISHLVGIVTAVAELDLGFKVDLKKRG